MKRVHGLDDYWSADGLRRRKLFNRHYRKDGLSVMMGPSVGAANRRFLLEIYSMAPMAKRDFVRMVCPANLNYGKKALDRLCSMRFVHVRKVWNEEILELTPLGRLVLGEFVKECEFFIYRTGGRLRLQSGAPILPPDPAWLRSVGVDISKPAEPAPEADPE